MKFIIYLFVFFYSIVGFAQTSAQSECVKGQRYEGVVFFKEYDTKGFAGIKDERYTPSKQEIARAEKIINEQISNVNHSLINQGDGCPIIHKSLKKYKRQYFGFIDDKGNKTILVNFIWGKEKDVLSRMKNDLILVLDGCSHYWNIKVNLSNDTLYDLNVNGKG